MQFRDLKRQYSVLKDELDAAMTGAAAEGVFIGGAPVKELEAELASYVGVKHCISCANGTDALTLALKVWGIGPGDAVFVPDFTFFSSAETVAAEGAVPVFVDVREDTFNVDVEDLERRIVAVEKEGRLRPRAIVAVDLFGLPAEYKALRRIADAHGLYILEDAAQGFGGACSAAFESVASATSASAGFAAAVDSAAAGSDFRRACSFGDIATTSFFPAKPLGCYGDGGAIFTDNDEWAALLESLKVHGKGTFKYDNVRIGMNSRLDTLQAAILKVKFKAFKEFELDAVNRVAARYSELLAPLAAALPSEAAGVLSLPHVPEGYLSSWAQYTIRVESAQVRDALQAHLKAAGIPSMVYYPAGMHAQTAFANLLTPSRPGVSDSASAAPACPAPASAVTTPDASRDASLDPLAFSAGSPVSAPAESACPAAASAASASAAHAFSAPATVPYGPLPVSEKLCATVLSLPCHPYMTEEEIRTVVDEIKSFYKSL